jgi:hypothetical protein
MVRGALWLVQEIGVGGKFTKAALRQAFPDTGQIDRRVRDLRDYGWVLHSSAEDGTLRQDEQRLVSVGVEVWDAKARRAASAQKAISAKERARILERDDFMCVTCGVAAGDTYFEGGIDTATIGVTRRPRSSLKADDDGYLVTQCKRCSSGGADAAVSVEAVLSRAASLSDVDRATLLGWIARGRRESAPIDVAWSLFRRLPTDARDALETVLRDAAIRSPEDPA